MSITERNKRRFARNFRALRGKRTLDSIARSLGCSYAAVKSWSEGTRIAEELLEPLAHELGVKASDLTKGFG